MARPEISLKVEPYKKTATTSTPVALEFTEKIVEGEPIIVIKVPKSKPMFEELVEETNEEPATTKEATPNKVKITKMNSGVDKGKLTGIAVFLGMFILVGIVGFFITRND